MKRIMLSTNPLRPFTVELYEDTWDDYHYKTTAWVRVIDPLGDLLDLGQAKFTYRGQRPYSKSWDALPEKAFELSDDWAALGQSPEYYEKLMEVPSEIREAYLRATRDVAWDPRIERDFSLEPAWETSVLRFNQATEALLRARSLFKIATPSVPARANTITFRIPEPSTGAPTDLTFEFDEKLKSPISAVIGYNGTGKTTALARIAQIAHADTTERDRAVFKEEIGEFVGTRPRISAVVMVSFSAFDTFKLPSERATGDVTNKASENDEYFGYSYCGLRASTSGSEEQYRLKSGSELRKEFEFHFDRAMQARRRKFLDAVLEELQNEPSLSKLRLVDRVVGIRHTYDTLSSGHKIVLSSLVHLCSQLYPGTLVLIDEPETHLHPSLLSALLRALRRLLLDSESRAIVATHSPIVLQELPASSVLVLDRAIDVRTASGPQVETFSENLETITSQVFYLDASRSDYRQTLSELVESYSDEELQSLFPMGLPPRALSYIAARRSGAAK